MTLSGGGEVQLLPRCLHGTLSTLADRNHITGGALQDRHWVSQAGCPDLPICPRSDLDFPMTGLSELEQPNHETEFPQCLLTQPASSRDQGEARQERKQLSRRKGPRMQKGRTNTHLRLCELEPFPIHPISAILTTLAVLPYSYKLLGSAIVGLTYCPVMELRG